LFVVRGASVYRLILERRNEQGIGPEVSGLGAVDLLDIFVDRRC
jgi:hypothetical protein